MISLSTRADLFSRASEVDRVTAIDIPQFWEDVEGTWLLRSLDYHEDAVFNCHLLNDLLVEVDIWHRFETERGDVDGRAETIEQIRQALMGALERGDYAFFLGA